MCWYGLSWGYIVLSDIERPLKKWEVNFPFLSDVISFKKFISFLAANVISTFWTSFNASGIKLSDFNYQNCIFNRHCFWLWPSQYKVHLRTLDRRNIHWAKSKVVCYKTFEWKVILSFLLGHFSPCIRNLA